jgi:hypothetical protein
MGHAYVEGIYSRATGREFETKWQAARQDPIDTALAQSYRFMNSGTQCTAFVSADGEYVLKFFKTKRFFPKKIAFTQWQHNKKCAKLALKRDAIFSAYATACDRLPKETGVLYTHFNVGTINHTVKITDAKGQTTSVALDEWDFVLQKRAVPLKEHLDYLLTQGDLEGAKQAISGILHLQRTLFHKGMRNRDCEFVNNYGFIQGAPVLFDAGRLLPCIGQEGRERYQAKLASLFPALQEWIGAFYPQLGEHCHREIVHFYSDVEEISMTSFHAPEPRWDCKALSEADQQIVDTALSQHYRYLSKGGQSLVFLSEDGNYVLKFFKQRIFNIPRISTPIDFLNIYLKRRKENQRSAKRNRIYSAYQTGCDALSQETGILYVHFNTTSHLPRELFCTLASGETASWDLNHCDFILQKRAERLHAHLDKLLAESNVNEAGESLKNLLQLYCTFFHKNVRDRDINIKNNYGFIEGKPALYDVGRLIPCVGKKGKKKYQKRVHLNILPRFRKWVKLRYPLLIPYCDAAIAEILKTIYEE